MGEQVPDMDSLTDVEKRAYRYLLYEAMLDIRHMCWNNPANPSPEELPRILEAGRLAGKIAYWLHNLALHSAEDFAGFQPAPFWRSFDTFTDSLPPVGLTLGKDYRKVFEVELDTMQEDD